MRNRFLLLADIPIIALAALGAFVLRFDWFFSQFRSEFALYVAVAVVLKPVVFYQFGLYGRYWRYASVSDLLALGYAVLVSSVLMGLLVYAALYTHVIEQFGRSVVLIDSLLTLFGIGAVHLSVRVIGEAQGAAAGRRKGDRNERRILIAGAGDAGAMVVREMQRNPQLGMQPIGFVDDDINKVGKLIHGVPVFGRTNELAEVVSRYHIDEVTIAMPTAPGRILRVVSEQCRAIGVVSRTMPGMYELLDGHVSLSRLRNVEIVDLLRRSQIEWHDTTAKYVTGRRVLVTGAGGSIGLELCRQVARHDPRTLVLLGHGENSLFEAEAQMRQLFPRVGLQVVVADIRDTRRISQVFGHLSPEIVFHAAAHKHVPLMEDNPEEAVSNNVLGTYSIVEAALAAGTERLVLISSDKAVSPASLMGASKRLSESVVQHAARRHGRAFVVVRFGNVLGSRGSVVPIFKQQIERGGPVTITHPDMQRFFMTIPEAVHLVLQAGGMGKGGELFVLQMGKAVRIVELVQDLIRLSGLEVDDIPIVYTGIRPGEKLEEFLWESGAEVLPTSHPDVLQVNETEPSSTDPEDSARAQLVRAVADGDRTAIEAILSRSIPTFAASRARAAAVSRKTN